VNIAVSLFISMFVTLIQFHIGHFLNYLWPKVMLLNHIRHLR